MGEAVGRLGETGGETEGQRFDPTHCRLIGVAVNLWAGLNLDSESLENKTSHI